MEYVVITLVAIAATTFIIYILANKVFGVSLRLKSLMLCAACALFISIVLPRIVVSFAGLAGTIGFLAVFALIFAYFVAYYDDSNKLQPAASSSTALSVMEEAEIVPPEQVVFSDIASTTEPAISIDAVPSLFTTSPGQSELVWVQKEIITEDLEDTISGSDGSEQLADQLLTETAATLEPNNEEPIEEIASTVVEEDKVTIEEVVTEPETEADETEVATDEAELPEFEFAAQTALEEIIAEPESEPESEPEAVEVNIATDEVETPEFEFAAQDAATSADEETILVASDVNNFTDVPEYIMEHTPDENLADFMDASVSSEAEEVMITLNIPDLQPPSDSLDDLLDFAFMLKEKEKYTQALDTFRKAFKLYRDNEASPFIAIEIANLLKNRGAYDEAITILTEGRGLDGVQRDLTLDQEFIQTIAFLRIVKNTLLQNRMGFAPYNEIPESVSEEINAEFREWRNLA